MKGGYTVADFEKSFVPFQHCSVYYDCGEINIVINKACNAWMVNATWSSPASFLESSTLPSTITWSECGRLLLPAVWLASKATAVTPNLNAAGYKLRLWNPTDVKLSAKYSHSEEHGGTWLFRQMAVYTGLVMMSPGGTESSFQPCPPFVSGQAAC